MKKTISQFGFLLSVLLIVASTAQAQYLVSSKAGFVNRVEGTVNIKVPGDNLAQVGKAALGTQLKEGEHISTEADSYAELLLSPGSYMRMNENTEVEAVRTMLDNSRFDVIQGSVIIEVGEIDKKLPIEIGTPRSVVAINKAGIYRIDVSGFDVAISVRKGEAYLGTREQLLAKSATKIGANKVVRLLGNGAPQSAKLSSKVFDAFDQWSYLRAESLVAANYSMLQRSRSRNALLSGWIYDPFLNAYTFVPSSWLFVTPYGFGFYRRYSDCDWCWGGYYNPYYGGRYGNGGTSVAGNSGANTGGAPARVSNNDRTDSRIQTTRQVQDRQVEPYSRPSVFYPTDRSSRYESPNVFDSSRSIYSPSTSAPVSSVPSRVEPSAPVSSGGDRGGGGRGDTSRTVGGRGN